MKAVITNVEAVVTNVEAVITNAEAVVTNAEAVITNVEAVITNVEAVVTNVEAVVTTPFLHPPSAKAYEKLPRLLEHLFKSLWILLRHNDTRVRQASSRT
ncbi:MAG TPA: hypothetical protein V6D11_29360 [Waterburya sp.]